MKNHRAPLYDRMYTFGVSERADGNADNLVSSNDCFSLNDSFLILRIILCKI